MAANRLWREAPLWDVAVGSSPLNLMLQHPSPETPFVHIRQNTSLTREFY